MRKNAIIFIVCILILLSIQSSMGITDTVKCKDCHGTIDPIPRSQLTKNCNVCHITHGCSQNCVPIPYPPSKKIHDVHTDAGRRQPTVYGGCTECHQSPVVCTNCHNSHKNVNLSVNDTNASICVSCHGKLPQPGGHEDFRSSLSGNKHQWMTCETCHINPYKIGEFFKFELHFKDLFSAPIDNSTGLCKICHSFQYERLKVGVHGKPEDQCISCHSPHTTQLGGPKFKIVPKETPINVSEKVESASKWVTTKVPIFGNPLAVYIIFIVIIVVIAEYLLSRHEEGTKLTYDMVKIQEKEDVLKTLEVKLKDQNIESLNSILEYNGIHILGMTMVKGKIKEEGEEKDIYKYVLFVSTGDKIIDEKGEKDIVDAISSISSVKSVEFTDKYEL